MTARPPAVAGLAVATAVVTRAVADDAPDGAAIGATGSGRPPAEGLPSVQELASHRDAMLRFARRKVRDEALAEDAVQDALAAALAGRESFQGQSTLRTWLIGILNHKIQDSFRRESRYVSVASAEDEGGNEALELMATERAGDQDEPSRRVERLRLGTALHSEIEALPRTLKDVFVMQVLEGAETAEVCSRLDITEANCWVRLHRARKRLSERLADHLN